MNTILVPTDFSACAENAVNFAVQSAKLLPLQVTLLHTFEVTENTYTDYLGVNKEFNQTLLHEMSHELARVKTVIKETEAVDVETYLATSTLKESILQVTAEKHVDFIVMGTSGASGIKEKLWGSRTADIIGKSRIPVIAIPVDYKWKKPQKILLSTNHFETEPAMMDSLFKLAALYNAQVEVAIFTSEEEDDAEVMLDHSIQIKAYKSKLAEHYKTATLSVSHISGKAFEETLQQFIKANHVDMLAMVTYKRKFPDNLFHPSITKKMAYHTKVPLLAIPANKVAG